MGFLDWLDQKAWLVELAIALFLLFGVNIFLNWTIARSKKKGQLEESDWRRHIDYAVLPPFRALLSVLLLSFLLDLMSRHLGFAMPPIAPWRNAGVVLCLAWGALRWVRLLERTLSKRPIRGKHSFDITSLGVVSKVVTILILFVACLLILQSFGVDIAPLLTFGGIGAAALGFASRDVVANFFGGLMLYVTRPFMVGDQIELPQKGLIGHIEEIGWYYTSLRDLQKKPIYLPNSLFSTELLINHSRITHRCIEEKISLRMVDTAQISKITAEVRYLLSSHPQIDAELPPLVSLSSFGAYSADLEIKAYSLVTRLEEFVLFKQEILLEIYAIVRGSGADFPNPTMTVELKS